MVNRVSTATAKAHLSALLEEVAQSGAPVIIERRGQPLAALVGLDDFQQIARDTAVAQPRGALALMGAWSDVEDAAIDALVDEIYAGRDRDRARPVDLSG